MIRRAAIIACLLAAPLRAEEMACPESPGVPYGMGFLDADIQARFGSPTPAPSFPAEATDWPGSWRISPPDDAAPASLGVMEIEEDFGALWLRWDADLADPCSPTILVPMRPNRTGLVADPDALIRAQQLGLYPAPLTNRESIPAAALTALRGLTLSRHGEVCQIAWPAPEGTRALIFQCNPFPGD